MTDPSSFKIEDTAFVLVGHQVGTISWAGELCGTEKDQLTKWLRFLARFAKAAGMPIVLTSSLETEAQGLLLPDIKELLPTEYDARIKRTGVSTHGKICRFNHALVGDVTLRLLYSTAHVEPPLHLVFLTPADDSSRKALERLERMNAEHVATSLA